MQTKIIDNCTWLIVTEIAETLFNSGKYELFKLYPDGSESLIEHETDLIDAKEKEFEIGVLIAKHDKTFYLLGSDAVREYNENGIDELAKSLKKDSLMYAVFVFIEGVTHSSKLAKAMDGWNDYEFLTEEEFNKLP